MPVVERRVMAPEHRGSTHSGVRFVAQAGGVCLEREAAAVRGRASAARVPLSIPLVPGVETIWDGRFAVTASIPGWRLIRAGGHFSLDRSSGVDASTPSPVVRPLARERVSHSFAPEVDHAEP
jgi:tRNA(Ile)-lysidine synthase